MEGDGEKVENLVREHKERVGKVYIESLKNIEKKLPQEG